MTDDIYLTLQELKKLFFDLLTDMLDGSPVASQVRWSWPTQGAPAFGINDDIVFLKIYDMEGALTKQKEEIYTLGYNMAVNYTRVLKLNCIFYGPNSWENVTDVSNKIYWQEYHDDLAQEKIYLIPGFSPLNRVPELWQGQWYERADLNLTFNEQIKLNREVPAIETVRVIVNDRTGVRADIDIIED
jgi:hypothetical protein